MAGYIRQDISNEIDDGQIIKAPPLDSEFNAIVAAFSAASGHRHNGASGEGSPITVLGPTQNVGISTNSVAPSVDNVVDLGSATLEFKDLWIDGVANIDLLTADAGTVAGAAITTVSNTQTLTGKTINLTDNTLVATSAQVAAAVTDETGTGALVFAGSPALTGTPTAPTAAAATNTTQIATTAHVFAERTNTASLTNKTIDLTNNTLILTSAQLATALTDETGTGAAVFAGSPALTGTPTAPTAVAGTNTTQIATTAHVFAERSNTATLTNKTITGGSISGITDLAVADGGTGASDAATARTNLGAQTADATLTSIAALGTIADRMIYTTGVDTWAETPSTAFGRSLMDDADATAGRATLGLGTIATQNAATVTITGGSITGITDLAVADGGTGASDASTARTNLGLVIGTDVQAFDADLSSWAGVTRAAGYDTFAATPTSANLRALLTDEVGTGAAYFVGGALGTPSSVDLTNATNLTTAGVAAATLVTASETIAANNNDTTLPTSAAVKEYADGIGRVLLASKTVSGVAVDFTEFNNAAYRYYEFVLENVKPVVDGTSISIRFSTDGGTTYDNAASSYNYSMISLVVGGAVTATTSSTAARIQITPDTIIGNAAGERGVSGVIRLFNPGVTAEQTRVSFETMFDNTAGAFATCRGDGVRRADQDTDALRFLLDAGGFSSGTIRMYGLK